ncbi:MAG TPA: hypothetical protein VGW78_06115 [Candidatus Babeliales bacterium]|nr:hypothetical protein [Candidatus Babeliales bacterium]
MLYLYLLALCFCVIHMQSIAMQRSDIYTEVMNVLSKNPDKLLDQTTDNLSISRVCNSPYAEPAGQ